MNTGLTSTGDKGRLVGGNSVPGYGLAVTGFLWVLLVCVWFAATLEATVGLLVPIAIAGLPLAVRSRPRALAVRWISVVLLAIINVIGGASIGWFLVPATAAMLISAIIGALVRD
jgi:hypothetical protein